MKQDIKKLQYLNGVSVLIFSLFSLMFLNNCDRETPSQPIDDGRPPAPPKNLFVYRAYDGEIGIEWNKNLELDISHYNIYRNLDPAGSFSKIDSTTNQYFIDRYLDYDSTYYYKITAVDRINLESDFSNTVNAQPKNVYAPYAPYGLSINARNWNGSHSIHLKWIPQNESDISHFEIYRSTTESFEPDEESLLDTSNTYSYVDSKNLDMLTNYFYKIVTVDKGGLTSDPSYTVDDIILDSPAAVFPAHESTVDYFSSFQIKTVSEPARYKIVVQTNELYGVVKEIDFESDKVNEVISIEAKGFTLQQYEDYYWRVYTYTNSNNPNSYSPLARFTIVPEN